MTTKEYIPTVDAATATAADINEIASITPKLPENCMLVIAYFEIK